MSARLRNEVNLLEYTSFSDSGEVSAFASFVEGPFPILGKDTFNGMSTCAMDYRGFDGWCVLQLHSVLRFLRSFST